ncbi:uncharacterized protein LOC119306807 [Triticum dicoccoides]|uniref:F-box domain-containing protein n=1 Tax=Triticum turgidum subsp. durum TaxID=4567 RepID=A0A9R0XNW5_TRITD|nr:uncharacterized protein LOC119306807 [Triticum dicoccoides]VAI40304.1 unnamed protein product [Triticum turgidum subsp. durum]
MESPPPKFIAGQDHDDRISALPDHLLLDVLERLDLREAVRAGALSTRWRRLPNHLSRVHLDVPRFQGATPLEAMDAFTGAARALLTLVPLAEGECVRGALRVLILGFYMSSPHLSSIARLVEDIVSLGQTECLEFCISPLPVSNTASLLAEIGQQFMSFSRAYPVAFSWLTGLTLQHHSLGHSDLTNLISACGGLRHLTLRICRLLEDSSLKIDAHHSGIQELKFVCFRCTRIELVSLPKLRELQCLYWPYENPPVHFGYVPELRHVRLSSFAMAWQAPFALSECLSRSAMNLSKLSLDFSHQMIWIQPEHPKNLAPIFRNLASVYLFGIFLECDLSWTLFILEAAPALLNIALSRHSCVKTPEHSAEKTNVVWEPSKDLKHVNLKLLSIFGCEDEDKVTNYIRLVMERAVGLKRIELDSEYFCEDCNAIDLERSKVHKASMHRIKERLTHGSSSSVEIIIV